MTEYDVIGIDDGHTFTDISEWSDKLANLNKIIIISALDSDIQRKVFPEIMKLIPLCENINRLDSVCPLTGQPAPFSIKINDNNIIPISRQGLISQSWLNQNYN